MIICHMASKSRCDGLTDYTWELFREAIPYSEINRMAEIFFCLVGKTVRSC